MRLLVALLGILFLLIGPAYQTPLEGSKTLLLYPQGPKKIQKRSTTSLRRRHSVDEFIENKLIEQGQALEHLVRMVTVNEELTKALIDTLGKSVEKPKQPEKVEVNYTSRRAGDDNNEENVFVKLKNNLPKYGMFLKDVITNEFRTQEDPIPLVEIDVTEKDQFTQHFFENNRNSISTDEQVNPWCSMAVVCPKSYNPICGYDDNFGYGKFDDICHMFQVNCYWEYKFSIVPSCRPH